MDLKHENNGIFEGAAMPTKRQKPRFEAGGVYIGREVTVDVATKESHARVSRGCTSSVIAAHPA